MPDIRPDHEGLVYYLPIVGARRQAVLVVRCDDKGEVYASIEATQSQRKAA